MWRGVLLLVACVLVLLPGTLQADEYVFWVSPDGSGDMSGSDIANAMRGMHEALRDVRYSYFIDGDDRVTLKVLPGTYHVTGDSLLKYNGWDNPYLVILGLSAGGGAVRPTFSGLEEEPLGPWTNVGGNVWETDWPYDFGWYGGELQDYVCGPGWEGWIGCTIDENIPDIASGQYRDGRMMLRREMIIQDGQRFTQVSEADFVPMMEYSFYTPLEGTGTVQINSPDDPNEVDVFAANAPFIFHSMNTRGLELHNLEFAYANPFIKQGMVDISSSETLLIDNCIFHHSNSDGLSIRSMPMRPVNPDDPLSEFEMIMEANEPGWWTVRNSYTHSNGFYGSLVAYSQGLLLENFTVRRNNLRGYESGTMDFDTGGMKLFRTQNCLVTGFNGEQNYGSAIWFDLDQRNMTLTNSVLQNNYFRGFYAERSSGPITLTNVILQNNTQPIDTTVERFRPSAMAFNACDTVMVKNCYISDPESYPVMLHSPDYLLQGGLVPPFGDEVYIQQQGHQFVDCTFVRPDSETAYFHFIVAPTLHRCYYMFHTEFVENTFITSNDQQPTYSAIAELVKFCPPVEAGNNYDLLDIYDSPWIEPPEAQSRITRKR